MKKRMMSAVCVLLLMVAVAAAQKTSPALLPPKGSQMAIVVFEDLQCPYCALYEDLLLQASRAYRIPLVRRDLPVYGHSWSLRAHVIAYWYEMKSPQLAEEFRHWVFANQQRIYLGNFQQKMNEFARAHGMQLPANVDPSGALMAKVNANRKMAEDLGINSTPTVYIVGAGRDGPVSLKVPDRDRLQQTIEEIKKRLAAQPPAPPARRSKRR